MSETVEITPVRWWQIPAFIRLNLRIMQDDEWAKRILEHPWAPSSLLEYGYTLAKMPNSILRFLMVDGERAGNIWMIKRGQLMYVMSIGLLARFRTEDRGMLIGRLLIKSVRFMEEHAQQRGCKWAVVRGRADNIPSQRLARLFHCRELGLATTQVTLRPQGALSNDRAFGVKPLSGEKAARSWKRWRLHIVEHVAGSLGVQAAKELLKTFPWVHAMPKGAQHLALYEDDQEIGYAHKREDQEEIDIGLFPAPRLWEQTPLLLGALEKHLELPIERVTLTRQHADALPPSLPHDRCEKEWTTLYRMVDASLMSDSQSRKGSGS